MKKILLLPAILFSLSVFAQTTTKQQDIENLLTALQIKPTMQNMVSKGIELYKKKKPAVVQQVWDDIKNTVDYTSYMNKVLGIFDTNYTQPEIKNLVSLAATTKPELFKFKNIVQQQLYNAGNEFGKKFGTLIKDTLKSRGY